MKSMFKRREVFGAIAAVAVVLVLIGCPGTTPGTLQVTANLADMEFAHDDSTARTVDLSKHFSTSRNNLDFSAESSKTSVATASRSGNTLTVTPEGPGTATVTVTADDGNEKKSRSFKVTVMAPPPEPDPAPPMIKATMASPIAFATVDAVVPPIPLGAFFSGATAYGVTSTMPTVADGEVDQATGVLTIMLNGPGATIITVTATNDDGYVSQSVVVTVGQPPEPVPMPPTTVNQLPDQNFAHNAGAVSFTLSEYFSGATMYVATSSSDAVVTAVVDDMHTMLTLTPMGAGRAVVTVTPSNDDGMGSAQTITVEVMAAPNMAPVVEKMLMDLRISLAATDPTWTLNPSGTPATSLNDYFSDPEDLPLAFKVEIESQTPADADDTPVVTLTSAPEGFSGAVIVTANNAGTATVKVTAIDSMAQSTPQTFVITVVATNADPTATGTALAEATAHTGANRLMDGGEAKTIESTFAAHFADTDLATTAGDLLTFSVRYVATGGAVDAAALEDDDVTVMATILPSTWNGDEGGTMPEEFTITVTPVKGGAAHDVQIIATDLAGSQVAKNFAVQVNQAPVAEGAGDPPLKLSEYDDAENLSGQAADITLELVAASAGYFHDDDDGDTLECTATPSDTNAATAPAVITLNAARTSLTIAPNDYKTTFQPMTVTVYCEDDWDRSPSQTFNVSVTSASRG